MEHGNPTSTQGPYVDPFEFDSKELYRVAMQEYRSFCCCCVLLCGVSKAADRAAADASIASSIEVKNGTLSFVKSAAYHPSCVPCCGRNMCSKYSPTADVMDIDDIVDMGATDAELEPCCWWWRDHSLTVTHISSDHAKFAIVGLKNPKAFMLEIGGMRRQPAAASAPM